jgi:hypothetical protein
MHTIAVVAIMFAYCLQALTERTRLVVRRNTASAGPIAAHL